MSRPATLRERLLAKATVDLDGPRPVDGAPCWLWGAYVDNGGYGRINVNRRPVPAYRVAYELWFGTLPTGLVPDHLCRVHCCINPAHLEAVTRRVNMLRGSHPAAIAHRDNRCYKGHLLAGDNVGYATRSDGRQRRFCRICRRASKRALYQRNKDRAT